MFERAQTSYDTLVRVRPRDSRTGEELEYRFADRYVLCDGQMWRGCVLELGELCERVEGELQLTPVFSDFSVVLDDSDGSLASSLLDEVWAGARVDVYVVPRECSSLSEGLRIYGGYVSMRGGVEVDGSKVRLVVEDAARKFDVEIPKLTFREYATDVLGYSEDELDIQEGKDADTVPVVFGNWQDAYGRYLVEAHLVDVGARQLLVGCVPEGYEFDDAGGRVQVQTAYGSLNEYELVDVDLAAGTAVISGYSYSAGDRFFVRPRGLRDSSGELVENPVSVAYVLIRALAGADSSVVDFASMVVARWMLKRTKVRRVLRERERLGDILAELGMEAGFRVRSRGGVLTFHVPDWLALDEDWPRFGRAELLAFERIAVDPDGLAAGRWVAKALYDPRGDGFELVMTSGEDGRYGFAGDAELEFFWLSNRKDVLNRLLSLEFLFGRHVPKVFELKLSHAAMELAPLDGFWCEIPWLFDDAQPFLALETSRELASGVVSVRALWLGYVFDVGRWSADDRPGWASSDEQDRRYWGYWTDDDGLCDPSNPDSNMSNWGP